jgi:hypothetical protein
MKFFLDKRAFQSERLENDLNHVLRAHIASTTAEGSPFLAGLVNGDGNDPPSSPPHWPVVPYVPGSSPLSSPPRRLDPQLEQIWALKTGQKDRVVGLSKEEALEKAVSEVLANTDRRGKRKITLAEVAHEFGVDAETLRQRLLGRKSRTESAIERRLLTPGEEDVVVAYIEHLYEMGIPPTKPMISDLAGEILTRRVARETNQPRQQLDGHVVNVGKCWVDRFVDRKPEIKLKIARGLESKRAIQTKPEIAYDFIDKLSWMLATYNIRLDNVHNMDEKGCGLGGVLGQATKVIIPSYLKSAFRLAPDSREWVSIIECISATGKALAPYFIFKGQVVLQRWEDTLELCFGRDWKCGVSENGWTDNFHGIQWLRKAFEPSTRPSKASEYRLLILDGHGSHLQADFLTYCMDHRILILQLPPHTSHFLQPLDVGVFGEVQKAYSAKIQELSYTGRVKISKETFIEIYAGIRRQSMSLVNIAAGFCQTGIWPISKTILNRHFQFNSTVQSVSPVLQLQTNSLPASETQELVEISTMTPTSRHCQLEHRESMVGCQHPGCKRMIGGPDVSPSTPNTPAILIPTKYETLLEMLVKEPDEDKRRELTTVLKAYGEDEKTKVKV